jgi:hypothetical protein
MAAVAVLEPSSNYPVIGAKPQVMTARVKLREGRCGRPPIKDTERPVFQRKENRSLALTTKEPLHLVLKFQLDVGHPRASIKLDNFYRKTYRNSYPKPCQVCPWSM